MGSTPLIFINILLISLISTVRALNSDGSITLPDRNVTVPEDQSGLTLRTSITLPDDTLSVGNVYVYVYSEDVRGRLISRPANASGTTQASPEAQMVRRFKLETANITLASQVTKNSTTNRFRVTSIFKIELSSSSLYRQPFVIRKVVVVFISFGEHEHRNEKQYVIFYVKPETTLLGKPTSPSVDINIVSGSLTTSGRSTIAVSPSVGEDTDGPPATGTSKMNEAIIAVPILFVVLIVLIASSLYCYYKREGRRIDDGEVDDGEIDDREIDDRKIGDTATAIQSKKGEGKNVDSPV